MGDHIQADRLELERSLWNQEFSRVMGLDEVGRGCLAGPVVAAGVILPPGMKDPGYRDSKQLLREEREFYAKKIKKEALYWTIGSCDPEEIDRLNILHASLKAMSICAESEGGPDFLLVDGNRYRPSLIPWQCVVKGDDRSASIAAASILAKVYRDAWMRKLHEEYPVYGWDTNVGYPTRQHFKGLEQYGYSPYHRKSFKLRTRRPCSTDLSAQAASEVSAGLEDQNKVKDSSDGP